jgi:hypothetical protein
MALCLLDASFGAERRPRGERGGVETIGRAAEGHGNGATRPSGSAQSLRRRLGAELSAMRMGDGESVEWVAGEHHDLLSSFV